MIPIQHGLANVVELNRAYSRAKNKLEDVRRRQREWRTSDPKPEQRITYVFPEILVEDPDKKEKAKKRPEDRLEERSEVKEPQPRSIKERLKENQKQVDEQKRTKRKRSVDRDSR